MLWFTSDWHLDHTNIIKYSKRPFVNVDEMNETIIENCNKLVKAGDTLYFLGDFCLSWNKDRPGYWLDRIKCKNLFIVWGNHDKPLRKNRQLVAKRFRAAGDILKVNEGSGIILCHYALRTWDQSHRGRYHLYGHSHGSLPDDETMLSFDVGVDCTNFFPLNFDEVKDRMASKKWGQKL